MNSDLLYIQVEAFNQKWAANLHPYWIYNSFLCSVLCLRLNDRNTSVICYWKDELKWIFFQAPSFYSASRKKRNIFILAKHDSKRLARLAGHVTCEGFDYASKSNNKVWPYPCPPPTFGTAWLYSTACLDSFQTVAMQLRALWVCTKFNYIL